MQLFKKKVPMLWKHYWIAPVTQTLQKGHEPAICFTCARVRYVEYIGKSP